MSDTARRRSTKEPLKGNRRRRRVVGRVQRRLLGAYVLHVTVLVLVFHVAVFGPALMDLWTGDADGLARDAIASQLNAFQKHIWPLLGLLLCVVALHAVAVTHRVAGPLVRIHRCLREVGEGDMSARVRIRRRDYLWLEAQVLNDMLDHLTERVERAERGADRAEALLDSARRSEHGARIIPREILVEQVEALISTVRDIRHRRSSGEAESAPSPRPRRDPSRLSPTLPAAPPCPSCVHI